MNRISIYFLLLFCARSMNAFHRYVRMPRGQQLGAFVLPPLTDSEFYTQKSFEQLIETACNFHVSYILARVETQVPAQPGVLPQTCVHYFDAASLDIFSTTLRVLDPINLRISDAQHVSFLAYVQEEGHDKRSLPRQGRFEFLGTLFDMTRAGFLWDRIYSAFRIICAGRELVKGVSSRYRVTYMQELAHEYQERGDLPLAAMWYERLSVDPDAFTEEQRDAMVNLTNVCEGMLKKESDCAMRQALLQKLYTLYRKIDFSEGIIRCKQRAKEYSCSLFDERVSVVADADSQGGGSTSEGSSSKGSASEGFSSEGCTGEGSPEPDLPDHDL
jgi:hypothetical protein